MLARTGTLVFVHNYDYAYPTGKGVFGTKADWLRPALVERRGTLKKSDWANELHPKPVGFRKIAQRRWNPALVEGQVMTRFSGYARTLGSNVFGGQRRRRPVLPALPAASACFRFLFISSIYGLRPPK